MPDQHFIIDIGPGLVTFLSATLIALPGLIAAYFGYQNKQAIATANSHLAIALAKASNPEGESKLTITPLPVQAG